MKLFKKREPEDRTPEAMPQEDGAGGAAARGGEGRRNAEATPKIGTDAVRGQTQHPAPSDDVGVPPQEVLAHEEEDARQGPAEDEETHVEHAQD